MLKPLVAVTLVVAAPVQASEDARWRSHQVVVLRDRVDVRSETARLAQIYRLKPLYPCVAIHGFLAEIPKTALRRLRKERSVLAIRKNVGRTGQRCAGE